MMKRVILNKGHKNETDYIMILMSSFKMTVTTYPTSSLDFKMIERKQKSKKLGQYSFLLFNAIIVERFYSIKTY